MALRQTIHADLVGGPAELEGEGKVEHVVLAVPRNNRSYTVSLRDWYEQWWGSLDQDRNGPPENADLWRERLRTVLDEHYVVGIQDHFVESVKLFAGEFGWQRLIAPRVRVNRARPPSSRTRRRGG